LTSDHPYLRGITHEQLMQDGWARLNVLEDWRPFADGNFATSSGKCEFYAEALAARGLDNSSYANLPRQLNAEKEPLLEMHRDDAGPRGI
jgi:hypothetical protein